MRSVIMPLLLVAVGPVLIASFAFNFNNFGLIFLLTGGGPFEAASTNIGSWMSSTLRTERHWSAPGRVP